MLRREETNSNGGELLGGAELFLFTEFVNLFLVDSVSLFLLRLERLQFGQEGCRAASHV